MIDKKCRVEYMDFFENILKNAPAGTYDEMALPSYIHKNKLMSWLFWKRIEVALSMAGDMQKTSVLDFGCGGGVAFRHFQRFECSISGCDKYSYDLAAAVCGRFGLHAELYKDLQEIKGRSFDYIFALDVLEHIEDLGSVTVQLIGLSSAKTNIIISGPTESLIYKIGRHLAGFSGHYHIRNIYDIERFLKQKKLRCLKVKRLYPPAPLFRVSAWSL